MYRDMQTVRNKHHHLMYHESEKSNENAVMTKDIPKVPTTNIERGIKACCIVLSMKSIFIVLMAVGIYGSIRNKL